MKAVSKHGHPVNELIDLRIGAWKRLSDSIFSLRDSAEKISRENGKDADTHMRATKRHLADIESYLAAYRDYEEQLAKLVG